MFKKILSICCLSVVASLNMCMEGDLYNSAPVIKIAHLQPKYENPAEEWSDLIQNMNEESIIKFAANNNHFVSENLSQIIEIVCDADLFMVVEYLKDEFILNERDKIICAATLGNINEIQKLTNFGDYIAQDDRLDLYGYFELLQKLKLPAAALDRILYYNRINYEDIQRERCLQLLIRKLEKVDIILEFISNANPEQLNVQELDGTTALHQAAITWDENQDQEIKTNQERIIKALLENGANPEISDFNQIRSIDLRFFKYNNTWRQWYNSYQNTHFRTFGSSNTSTRNFKKIIENKRKNSYFTFEALATMSIIAAAAFYICYKGLSKSNATKIVKIK